MPVGKADKGVGAMKGTVYYGVQLQSMFIDWWHDPVEGEPFEHSGLLNTYLISPSIIYGASDKINIMASTQIGVRSMVWDKSASSIHHRTETTSKGYKNANPGLLGETKVLIRYLAKNDGIGEGSRIIMGGGLSIPSKSELTSDPFFLSGKEKGDHRHFSLSSGAYKYILESQIFFKQPVNPVFYGGFIMYEHPIEQSQYGYKPPPLLNASISATFKRFDSRDTSIGYGLGVLQSGKGYWNGFEEPNSQSLSIIPSLSFLVNSRFGALSFNLQKPVFVKGAFITNEGNIKQGSNIWQFAISLRKV